MHVNRHPLAPRRSSVLNLYYVLYGDVFSGGGSCGGGGMADR